MIRLLFFLLFISLRDKKDISASFLRVRWLHCCASGGWPPYILALVDLLLHGCSVFFVDWAPVNPLWIYSSMEILNQDDSKMKKGYWFWMQQVCLFLLLNQFLSLFLMTIVLESMVMGYVFWIDARFWFVLKQNLCSLLFILGKDWKKFFCK